MALADKLDKQHKADAPFLSIEPDDQERWEEMVAPWPLADAVPAHMPRALEDAVSLALSAVRDAAVPAGAEVVGFYRGRAVVCVGWKHSKPADDDTLNAPRPAPPPPDVPVVPPADAPKV